MLASLPLNSPYLIWDGHPFCSWVCWRPSLSCPAQHAAADCPSASGVFPLTLGCRGFNQRARLSSAETDAFFSCLSLWFWKESGSLITYCISYFLYLFIKESSAVLCCCVVCSVGRMPGSFGTAQWGDLDRMRGGVKGKVARPQQVLHNCLWHRWADAHKCACNIHTLCKYTCVSMHTHTLMQVCRHNFHKFVFHCP